MWIVAIIIIVLAFVFLPDKKQESQRVVDQGGFYIKYNELIQYFLSIPDIKVEKKEKMRIILLAKAYAASTRFTIAHGFEDVSIYWHHQSMAFGEHSLSWTFPESMPQQQMLSLMEKELGLYERNVLNQGT